MEPDDRGPRAGKVALALAERLRSGGGSLLYVAADGGRADRVARAVRGLFPELPARVFPDWDCLPYDRVSPSLAVMGRRVSTLRALERQPRGLVITTASAAAQRVPPRGAWADRQLVLERGASFDLDRVRRFLRETGYVLDDRVDEPGEAAIRGEVIDLFPAAAERPVRAEHADGVIEQLRVYDPLTQRTLEDVARLVLEPASELVLPADAERPPGLEHWLPDHVRGLETLLDYLPDAELALDPGVEESLEARDLLVQEAWEGRLALRIGPAPVAPERLYVPLEEWRARLAGRVVRPLELLADPAKLPPLEPHLQQGGRALLAAPTERDLARLVRRVGRPVVPVAGWTQALEAPAGTVASVVADLDEGFEADGVLVLAVPERPVASGDPFADEALRPGDLVVHLEHGIGRLLDFRRVPAGEGETDCVVIGYANDASLLVPADEIGKVWRYGSAEAGVTLDRLGGRAWRQRRSRIEEQLAETAVALVALAGERESARAPELVPPRHEMRRFVRRFPHPETPDQRDAIGAVLHDLASGRPMDRLVCGDVGYGKTEVTLRACAAAVLAGKQVAVAAPTTVLARQHLETFRSRFAGFGVRVEWLSRVATRAAADEVRRGLKDGTVQVVVGTHALASRTVGFANLGLVVVDEEQRFGRRHKQQLRALGGGAVHQLTLTATPIPRTLLTARIGLQDLSVIATPPVRRQPVRTVVARYDPVVLQAALRRERRRGGQSFVVCPHVEDLEGLAAALAALTPELSVAVAHGQLPARELDEAVLRFSRGEGDVLLSTDLVESGLDIPTANTMVVWRADRFGIAQLHQLRGRVGRGRIRGVTYLLLEPDADIPEATEKRLRTLESHDRLGAGFAIAQSDLDRRGAGELLGEAQSGHVARIGAELTAELLERAVRVARGQPDADEPPELHLSVPHGVPETYVPEPELRLGVYRRLAQLRTSREIARYAEELEDRFGPAPEPVLHLLAATELRLRCLERGVARLDLGPKAIVLTFRAGRVPAVHDPDLRWSGERLVLEPAPPTAPERLRAARALLDRLG